MINSSIKRRLSCLLCGFILFPMLSITASGSTGTTIVAPDYQTDETTPPDKLLNVSGTVTDIAGVPLIGVSIIETGTLNGVTTDLDGKFSLEVAQGSSLEISCIGFSTQTIGVANAGPLNIVLKEDTQLLDEVVVTALGIKREQKALSYNVQEVKGDKLTTVKDANFITSLQGKVAGAIINSSSAGPGAAARIIMRGTKSLVKDDNALYVIDGIPMFNINGGDNAGGTMTEQPGSSSVADINPEDIESLSVLTGPSAAALYGSDAANGVVLITTKKGAEGKVKVTYSNSTSFLNPMMMPRFQDRYANADGNRSWGPLMSAPSGYNPADFFNTGVNEINGITFTAGTAKNQTYASVSSTNSTGILPNNSYNRYNFSFRNTTKFAKDKLTLDVGAQYVIQNNKNMVGGGLYFNPLVSLYLFPRGESFHDVQSFERWNETRGIMEQYWPTSVFGTDFDMQNPYWIMHRITNTLKKHRYMLNASLKWDVTKWLNIVGRIRVDNSDQDWSQKRYATTTGTFTEGSDRGFYNHTKQSDRTLYGDVIANISKNFVDDKLSLNANIGASFNDMQEDVMYLKGGLDQIPNFFHLGNIKLATSKRNESAWHDQSQSVFANVELGWDHMVYLTLTGRNDWDSRLAFTSKKSYFYPSAGLSFLISELFDSPVAVPYLKVRASWAEVASAPSRYLTQKQYTYNEQTNIYEFPSIHYDPNLKPENTKSWEVGVNAKFYESRFNLDLTYYRSNTYNQTFYVDASASSGYKQNIVQTGNIQNQGIEAGIGYTDSYASDKVKFSTGFTFTMNDNKIISLANGAVNPETGEAIEMDYYSKGVLGLSGGPTLRLTEGGTMGDLYINQRLRQSPNGYIYATSTNDVEIETTEYRKIGSLLAKCHVGWNTSLSYAGVNLNIQFTGRFGGLVVSDTQALLDRYGVSETTAAARDAGGVDIGEGRIVDAKKYYDKVSTAIGTYYTYDATNIRLSELSLSYTLPSKWFKDKLGLTVGVTGKNLWMIYCKAPFDPESTSSVTSNFYQGVDLFQLPSLRSLGFNVKLSF